MSGRGQTLLPGLEHSADGLGRQLLLALLAVTNAAIGGLEVGPPLFRVSCLVTRIQGGSWIPLGKG